MINWWPVYDGNDDIASYTVSYTVSSSEAGPGLHNWAEVNSTSTLLPVKPWLNYTFSVQAYNQIGQSDASETVYCTTLQTAPFEHPRNVCTLTRLSNQLVIVWQVRTYHTLA